MKAQLAIAGVLAMVVHALALFGPYWSTPARPLPLAPESLEVELTSTPDVPAPPPDTPVATEPEPPVPEPAPVPEPLPAETPLPTPIPEPAPEMVKAPEPETPRTPPPKPPPSKATPKSAARVAKPAAPVSSGSPNGTGKNPLAKAGPTLGVRVRSNPAPAYPSASRRARQEGTVTVDVQVSTAGLPLNVALADSSGFPALDQAALAAVLRWRFDPAQTAGIPVAGRVRVPVRFQLKH